MYRHSYRHRRTAGSHSPPRILQPSIWLSQWIGILVLLLVTSRLGERIGGEVVVVATAFEWSSSAARRPEVNRQALAGIWKLTPTLPHPLKEFTVYPKKPRVVPPELLLLLKEDGSFQQYETTMTPQKLNDDDDDDCDDDAVTGKPRDIDATWKQFQRNSIDRDVSRQQQRQQQDQLFPWVGYIQTGKWAYLDGQLLLAADRIDSTTATSNPNNNNNINNSNNNDNNNNKKWTNTPGTSDNAFDDGVVTTTTPAATTRYDAQSSLSSTGNGSNVRPTGPDRSQDDTLLKGRVIASYQTRLDANPILSSSSSSSSSSTSLSSNETTTESSASSLVVASDPAHRSRSSSRSMSSTKIKFDTYLSVPRGSIHVGKFMYPKNHPSFFEQPMFQPKKMGNFALRQVLGTLNAAANDERQTIEKYQRSDFYNRTFLLTSHPLRQRSSSSDDGTKRGEKRWSIKYNDYVYDRTPSSSSSSKSKQPMSDPDAPTSAVRVLQIVFHRNNTFSTTGGLGNAAILRGKFDIIGPDKDHLWMQVIRFGFGRSVSGSVYSEGPMLSHEDVKAYWGQIRVVTTDNVTTNRTRSSDDNCSSNEWTDGYDVDDLNGFEKDPSLYRIEVEGSVLDGLGLEPMPVARFLLREIDPASVTDDDDDDDDDDDETTDALEATSAMEVRLDDDGVDWKSMDDSFQ